MIQHIVYCDICKRECTQDSVDLTPVRFIQGQKPHHSNRNIQMCMECFNSVFNREMNISFAPEGDMPDDFYEDY